MASTPTNWVFKNMLLSYEGISSALAHFFMPKRLLLCLIPYWKVQSLTLPNSDLIKETVIKALEKKHKTGDRAGGSSHLGFVSLVNVVIEDTKSSSDGGYRVSVSYDIFVETEFEYSGNDDHNKKHYSCNLLIDSNLSNAKFV